MTNRAPSLINLYDSDDLANRRPILIAHRGGVIAPNAPENSRRALALAAEQGYDMVELDVRRARDGVPFLFHGAGGIGSMLVDCEVSGRVEEFTSSELQQVHYRGTGETILSLEEAIGLCTESGMGIMLDIKTVGSDPLPADFLQTIRALLDKYGLHNATMTLSQRPEVQEHLPPSTMRPIRANTLASVLAGGDDALAGRYWFDDPDSVTEEQLHQLKARGALTIACINSFRYPPHSFDRLEETDIQAMAQIPVDGYQIDSRYGRFFPKLRVQN